MKKKSQVSTANACFSCNKPGKLTPVEVSPGVVFDYCDNCLKAHNKEFAIKRDLGLLRQTHPYAVNQADVLGLLMAGRSLEEIKSHLDKTASPELRAELQEK